MEPISSKELKEVRQMIDRAYWGLRAEFPSLRRIPTEAGKDRVTNFLLREAFKRLED